jgi:hypothetical protein
LVINGIWSINSCDISKSIFTHKYIFVLHSVFYSLVALLQKIWMLEMCTNDPHLNLLKYQHNYDLIQTFTNLSIQQHDIFCISERGVNYTVYITDKEYVRNVAVKCNTLEQSYNIDKETVSIFCYKSLSGKYLEIVASGNTRFKVFEIQHFGKYNLRMKIFFCSSNGWFTNMILSYLHLQLFCLDRLRMLNISDFRWVQDESSSYSGKKTKLSYTEYIKSVKFFNPKHLKHILRNMNFITKLAITSLYKCYLYITVCTLD